MQKKVVLLVCLLISAGWGGGLCQVSIASKAIDRSNILSADIPDPAADLSSLVLTLQDLPPGFTDMSSDYVASLKDKLGKGRDFKPGSIFAYQKMDSKLLELQVLIGFTLQLSDSALQAAFDQAIAEGIFAKALSQGLNDDKEFQFTPPATLTLEDKIGEVSAGWRSQGKIENIIPMNVDLAMFRRGQIGVVMASIYLDGAKPTITISEAGRKFDSRIMELKPDLTQSQ